MSVIDIVGSVLVGLIVVFLMISAFREFRPKRSEHELTDHQRALFKIDQLEAEISAKPLPKLITESYEEGERQFKQDVAATKWHPWFEGDQFMKDLEQAERAKESAERVERDEIAFRLVEIDITAINDRWPRTIKSYEWIAKWH